MISNQHAPSNQIELNFGPEESASAQNITETPGSKPRGYDIEAAIAEEWGLPLGESIRLWLKAARGCLEGRLELDIIPSKIDRRQPLGLRICGQRLSSRDIDSWSLLDETSG